MKRLALAAIVGVSVLAPCAVPLRAQAPSEPIDRLRAAIARTTTSVNATWGIYIKSLETSEEIALDADRRMRRARSRFR